METGQLLVERQDRVLLLALSDPRTRNALHPGIYRAGIQAMTEAESNAEIGAVVLTGANGGFCGGGNLNRLIKNREKPEQVQSESIGAFHDWIRAIKGCPKPVIAAVEGSAAGAGFSLVLACDLIVAAEDAKFTMAYVKVGLSPDGGSSALLGRGLAPQLVMEILLGGNPIGAERLHQLGLVNRLCAKDRALDEALQWARALARGPSAAMARIKALANAAADNDLDTQLDLEREKFLQSLFHPECGEGIAAFLEKRPADFKAFIRARPLPDIPKA